MFTESGTVAQMILDAAVKFVSTPVSMVREEAPPSAGKLPDDVLRLAR